MRFFFAFKIDKQKYKVDIGINYNEVFNSADRSLRKKYFISDIGDLSIYDGFEVINADGFSVKGKPQFEQLANLSVINKKKELIIGFNLGVRI